MGRGGILFAETKRQLRCCDVRGSVDACGVYSRHVRKTTGLRAVALGEVTLCTEDRDAVRKAKAKA